MVDGLLRNQGDASKPAEAENPSTPVDADVRAAMYSMIQVWLGVVEGRRC